tara:strand:+ start:3213 stop:3752 length:540 start_codon:yes stop_codon:yes gene_type:complete
MSEMSQVTNQREFIRGRTLSLDQLDECLGNSEVQRRFSAYTDTSKDNPMSGPDALETALTDVFCGAKNRSFRLYRNYATEAHVRRLKNMMSENLDGTIVKVFVPDMVGLRENLRNLDDMGTLSGLLVAEQSGRNNTGEVRAEAINLIVSRIKSVQDNVSRLASRTGPTKEELAEITSNR